jgi:hypothetical protein
MRDARPHKCPFLAGGASRCDWRLRARIWRHAATGRFADSAVASGRCGNAATGVEFLRLGDFPAWASLRRRFVLRAHQSRAAIGDSRLDWNTVRRAARWLLLRERGPAYAKCEQGQHSSDDFHGLPLFSMSGFDENQPAKAGRGLLWFNIRCCVHGGPINPFVLIGAFQFHNSRD